MIKKADQFVVAIALLILLLAGCEQTDNYQPVIAGQAAVKIVSLSPHITELVFAAGAGEHLVGVVEYSDFPPAAVDLPHIGSAFRVDYEVLRQLQPDLILAWQSGNPVEIIERLNVLGYHVVALEPQGLESVADQLQLVGQLAGTSVQADQAAAKLRKNIMELRSYSAAEEPLSVFWQIAADPYFTVTGRHIINDVLELCGGRNIFANAPGLAPAVTLEAILAERPDVIIASVRPGDDVWKNKWQSWSQLPAVQNKHLYAVDPDLISRPGPRIVHGAAQICAALADARS
ncbi:MAG: cobalamin-binding protein [Gammaproteobacteria bacterium]|nr:cobalamin-binding protein [Gammaproteobacteria bacterium]